MEEQIVLPGSDLRGRDNPDVPAQTAEIHSVDTHTARCPSETPPAQRDTETSGLRGYNDRRCCLSFTINCFCLFVGFLRFSGTLATLHLIMNQLKSISMCDNKNCAIC